MVQQVAAPSSLMERKEVFKLAPSFRFRKKEIPVIFLSKLDRLALTENNFR